MGLAPRVLEGLLVGFFRRLGLFLEGLGLFEVGVDLLLAPFQNLPSS